MDPTSKSTGTTILGKIQDGRHSRTIIIISLYAMNLNDVNINFTYFEVNGFTGLSLNMIRVICVMFRLCLAFLRPKIYRNSINLLKPIQVWP